MTAERWSELKRIFNGALDTAPDARDGYIATECNGDTQLRREVESLLHEYQQAGTLTSPLRDANPIGETIAHYRIVGKLGRGGMGVVYKGEDVVLGRPVALKFVAPEVSHVAESRARFLREAMAAAAVIHPNLCTLLEVEEDRGQLFLVMNFVDGVTLREKLAAGPLPLAEALRIAAETASGLHALHSKGIIHRDIKSSNIMIEHSQNNGRAVITDFGIASVEGQDRITRTGGELGTVAYMSPELLAGGRPDPRSDIWSLGVVLFEMLSGHLPFHADNQAALAAAIQNTPHCTLASLVPGVPAEVEHLLDRMLQKDPAQRRQRADELERDLCRLYSLYCRPQQQPLLSGVNVGQAPVASRTAQWSWSSKVSFGTLMKAAVLLGALSLAAPRFFRTSSAPNNAPVMLDVPETSYPGMEDSAVFSPDGRQVAFSWQNLDDGKSSICVKMISDDDKICLGDPQRDSILPAWSPDGRWIAYLRRVSPTRHEIVLSSPLGGQERVLSQLYSRESLMHLSRMAWTADSKALIISDQDLDSGRNRLYRLSLDTLERTPITDPHAGLVGDRTPAVSRDGKWLAFVRETHLLGEIAVMPLNAEAGSGFTQPRMITSQNRFLLDLAWTPSGEEIIFSAADAISKSDFRLFRMPFHGDSSAVETPQRIDLAPSGSYSPAISPDGTSLIYTYFQNDQNIWRVDRDSISAPWSSPRQFTEISSTRDDAYPSYSPDGNRLSFVSNRSGKYDLWVSNNDGSNPRQLTDIGTISGTSTWSPDGKQIAFDWNNNGNWDAYVINAEGGTPRRLTSDKYDETTATWSRDGRYLYINSNQSGSIEIWRLPIAGGPSEQITHNGGIFAFESPDAKSLIYTRHHHDTGPVYELSLTGGVQRQIVDEVQPLCFFVSPRGLYYFGLNPDRSHRDSLRYLDFARRKTDFIFTSSVPVASSVTVSPDERTVLFTLRERLGSDIMRIENFR